ncbi:uncharacterized protein EKO05_0008141 [Ascochyta rabiei]|uniref:uncharacterized protein n=1 Tax=Didymella rabiei TaxID=5454 RepID=UPI002203A961|nr:uncharacterized protein EKO05_0008141 [Ascochyta rabiei]UPX17808.1 hypothetical protein EKO05_0008141 [Ascochyta rabiei]
MTSSTHVSPSYIGVLSNLCCSVGFTAAGRLCGTFRGGSVSGGIPPGRSWVGGAGSGSYILRLDQCSVRLQHYNTRILPCPTWSLPTLKYLNDIKRILGIQSCCRSCTCEAVSRWGVLMGVWQMLLPAAPAPITATDLIVGLDIIMPGNTATVYQTSVH